METLVFTLGQVTTGGQRQEAVIFFFLPYVLKSLLSLLGEKLMIREGKGGHKLLLQKSRQEMMVVVLEDDEKWLGYILKVELTTFGSFHPINDMYK